MSDIFDRMTSECRAPEFKRRVEAEVFAVLPIPISIEHRHQAQAHLQDLFMAYRNNPCISNVWAPEHECVLQVYYRAYDRLMNISPILPKPKRRKRAQPQREPTDQERAANLAQLLSGTITGKEVPGGSDDS